MVTKILGILLCLSGLGLTGYYLYNQYSKPPEIFYEPPVVSREESKSEPEPAPGAPEYPVGDLIIVPERDLYDDGDLQLYVPRLDLVAPIYNGIDDETLKKGVGLFTYSQLPGLMERNSNVSLAGHRDIYGEEFYYIDTITQGDMLYLTYGGSLYTYEYEYTIITHDRDWDPIRVKDYSCITLQSCTPIGLATERIFVVGRLVGITPGASFPQEGPAAEAAAIPEADNTALLL